MIFYHFSKNLIKTPEKELFQGALIGTSEYDVRVERSQKTTSERFCIVLSENMTKAPEEDPGASWLLEELSNYQIPVQPQSQKLPTD